MSVQEALPSQIKSPPYPSPPPTTTTKEDKRIGNGTTDSNPRPGIQVPRQRYISVSKSELLDAIVSAMFPSQEEARQFLSLALPNFLSRISMSDIWKPASRKSCGNDLRKMLRNAISILSSQSVLQELAFEELILLYTDEIGERETTDQGEVPSLQLKIYERIPIPDLPVVFPHKKLSFRILDTVRLDVATIVGLLAYFFSYRFEDILSSPSAALLDVVAASALVLYVTRVLLGYKQTRDRYQLLVNRTLYEKTVASGFGSIHFLLDASEQQQYKEAILVYAILLKAESSEVTSTRAIRDQCETFLYDFFQEKVEMPVEKAIETVMRLGLATENKASVDGEFIVQAVPCTAAYLILQTRWNSLLIN